MVWSGTSATMCSGALAPGPRYTHHSRREACELKRRPPTLPRGASSHLGSLVGRGRGTPSLHTRMDFFLVRCCLLGGPQAQKAEGTAKHHRLEHFKGPTPYTGDRAAVSVWCPGGRAPCSRRSWSLSPTSQSQEGQVSLCSERSRLGFVFFVVHQERQ